MGRNKKSYRHRFVGFTLAELIVVVVILSISAAMVIPYATNTSSFQAVSAARVLSSDLEYAQNVAIVTQTPVEVVFDVAGDIYTLYDANTSTPLKHPITKEDYVTDFSMQSGFSDLDILSANFDGNQSVTFDEMGAPDNSGNVRLRSGVHTYRISVAAATGKVTVTELTP